MESYGADLTSPPLPLVALVGPPEALPPLADYLRSQHAPRLQSLGVPDAHSAAGAFGARKVAPSAAPPAGILKAGWLRKHRTSRPAVAALLVDRASVVGDPSSWAWLVSQLDAVRAATKSRGARIVVIITQQAGAAEVPEDRIAMICRQAGIERRCVVMHTPSEGLPAMQVVGRVLAEQAALFYATDAQRRLTAHAHRNVPSPDLNLRTAFKLGALAEFRADWPSALRMYGEAYGYLPQILAAAGPQPQRYAEVRAVAEQVHVKTVSLLLLAVKQVPEALAQFDTHLRLFRRVPFEAPPGLAASHHAWLCRQHMVLAELLLSAGLGAAEQLKREHQPGQLYLAAAQAAIERRKAAAFISGMHGGNPPPAPGKVGPGQYVGQVALLPSDPAAAAVAASGAALTAALAGLPASGAAAVAGLTRKLSEDEFELYLEAEECGVQHSKATVDLLRTAQDALARSGRRASKTLQHCMLLLGHELLEAGDAAAAERLLTQVAGFYRRERWEGPLASALLLLRECHQHSHDLAAHAELSLEVSALEGSSLDPEQRAAMATAAASVLAPQPPLLDLGESTADAAGAAGSVLGAAQQLAEPQQAGTLYSVASSDSPWLTVLPLSAGFFDPLNSTAAAATAEAAADSPTSSGRSRVRFASAVWNNAPVDLPFAAAEVQLRDGLGSYTARLQPEPSGGSSRSGAGGAGMLSSGAWLRWTAAVPVRCSGRLEATAVTLRFGDDTSSSGGSPGAASVTYQLPTLLPEAAHDEQPSSPRAGRPPPAAPPVAVGWLRGGWAGGRPPFSLAAGFLPGRWRVEVPPQHDPPLLLVQAPEALLQGEQAAVTITVGVGLHAIQGAVLQAKAVHVDSQQELGLLPTAASLAALPAGAAGAASAVGSPAAASSPAAAGPGGTAAALPPGASSPSSGVPPLAKAASTAGDLRLGDLAAGQRRQMVLLLDARYSGPVDVLVELKYSAASHDVGTPGGTTKPEQGHCTVLLPVQVRVPWRLAAQLLGPPATHTLLAAAVPSGGTAGPGSSAGSSSGGGGGLEAEPSALLAQQAQRLQSLSLQDSQAASGADLGAAADSRDLAMLLLRSLPPRLVLPAGQRCTALVQLQSQAAVQVDVLSVDLEAAEGAAAAAAVASAAQPAAAGSQGSAQPAAAAAAAADTLGKGDIFTAAFSLTSASAAPAELPSLGFLRLRWRRTQRRPQLAAAAVRGGSRLAPAAAAAEAEAANLIGSRPGSPTAAAAAPACEVLVPLPPASFLAPLLTAELRYPPASTAGQAAVLQLLLSNGGPTNQEVAVAVGDPHGFLLSGPKSTTVQLLPHSATTVTWHAAPYHIGLLPLPDITVTSAQHGQAAPVSRGCALFVERPPEQVEQM